MSIHMCVLTDECGNGSQQLSSCCCAAMARLWVCGCIDNDFVDGWSCDALDAPKARGVQVIIFTSRMQRDQPRGGGCSRVSNVQKASSKDEKFKTCKLY